MMAGCVRHGNRRRRWAYPVVWGGIAAMAAGCAQDARYVLVDCWTLDPHVRAEAQGAGHCLDPFATYRVPKPPTQVAALPGAGENEADGDPGEPPPSDPSRADPRPSDPPPDPPPPDDPPEDPEEPEDPGGPDKPDKPDKAKPGKGRGRSALLDGVDDVLAGLDVRLGS